MPLREQLGWSTLGIGRWKDVSLYGDEWRVQSKSSGRGMTGETAAAVSRSGPEVSIDAFQNGGTLTCGFARVRVGTDD